MSPHPTRLQPAVRTAALALLVAATAVASTGTPPARIATTRAPRVICTGAIQHPIDVHIQALDLVRRGGTVRLRVNLTAARAIERGEVRLTSSSGAAVAGARRVTLRAVPAGGQSAAEFSVIVPASGARTYVQFEVEAEGEFGLLRRGAAYNLLPDGPAEHPRVARTAAGEAVAEVTARRIDQ